MTTPQCIYIASRLSSMREETKITGRADIVIEYLFNLRQSLKAGAEVWRKGHYPYVPGYDFMLYLELDDKYGIMGKHPYKAGLEWVKRCDAILLVNGYKLLLRPLPHPREIIKRYGLNSAQAKTFFKFRIKWISYGVQKEFERAVELGKEIYWSLDDIPPVDE